MNMLGGLERKALLVSLGGPVVSSSLGSPFRYDLGDIITTVVKGASLTNEMG